MYTPIRRQPATEADAFSELPKEHIVKRLNNINRHKKLEEKYTNQ